MRRACHLRAQTGLWLDNTETVSAALGSDKAHATKTAHFDRQGGSDLPVAKVPHEGQRGLRLDAGKRKIAYRSGP